MANFRIINPHFIFGVGLQPSVTDQRKVNSPRQGIRELAFIILRPQNQKKYDLYLQQE